MYIFTLQGPTADGNHLLESWEISQEVYLHFRSHVQGEPVATTLTDRRGQVISQRLRED